ncbi:unnamed protein product [Zymoseptoria tritici ST99CH_3D1]|uniref:Uncharacterized protein n=2 Tax=Zymoseptoria tritici TaxID=1047171 RepID=A0A1X7RF70_ZYMT9|nr:unnamed protein product [Zymoseptoria tritici ST99CH_3D7]SMR42412.1 unnamed protein product [Zymoseptoria tritici ST99CH_1E4]SMR44589.1 unnamed protein product [Zymoseptoria tritici ST99CH_3D1]
MLFQRALLATAFATVNGALACTNCTNESPEPITLSPAPWTLKGDIYGLFLLPGVGIPLTGNSLPIKTFPPLERQHPESIAGEYIGKLGMIQVIRYTDSPVGPYDELLIVPGFFSYEDDGQREQAVRVSRIYVSQKYTEWNGRANWNIPKHMARFDWSSAPDGSTTVRIYPFDTSNDPAESSASEKPFFQMTFSPLLPQNLLSNTLGSLFPGGLNLNPSVPFSTDLYPWLGVNATLVQPPIPLGNDIFGGLAEGGPNWKSVIPGQSSKQTTFGTINMDQSGGDGEETGVNAAGDEFFPNFWPGLARINAGIRMLDATITFSGATEMPGVIV